MPVDGPVLTAPPANVGHGLGESIGMGLVYGLLQIIGPDHLGTLMTLSAAASRSNAFKVGAAWGLGHSSGMAIIASLLLLFRRHTPLTVEAFEHYGDYLVGLSMIVCALYFVVRESSFIEKQSDGTYVQKSCDCHPAKLQELPRHKSRQRKSIKRWCDQYGSTFDQAYDITDDCPVPVAVSSFAMKEEPPCELQERRDLRGALIGILQGLCCPMGLVGVSFLATLNPSGIIAFVVTFLLVSTLGMAWLAMGWAYFTSVGLGASLSPMIMYRGSCGLTFAFGIFWMIANYHGFLGELDYTERIHG